MSCCYFLFRTTSKQIIAKRAYTMSLLEKLSINKKITAIFADGTQKMNLGVKSVVDLLNGADRVPVEIAPVQRATRLLTNLAESAGRTVQTVEEGVFLVQPGVEVSELAPEVDQEIVQSEVESVVVEPKLVKTTKVPRKYATLSKTFFNGSSLGQVLSIYKTRETNPAKWADYRAAVVNGDCVLPTGPFSKSVAEKMKALGFNVLE